jgi:hypothetical protein
MSYDEDNDLFEPETFGERIRSHTSDIIILFLLGSVVTSVIGNEKSKKNGDTINKIEQSTKSVQNLQQQKTIFFNDSVNQKIY